MNDALLDGLPDPVARAVGHVPREDTQLLELAVEPPGLLGSESRVAANTRTFILGWDPLPPEEQDGTYVTANGDDDYEVVLYVTRWVLLQAAEAVRAPLASLLGSLAREVARRGAHGEAVLHAGAYPRLVGTGGVGPLLPDPDGDDDHLDTDADAASRIAAASKGGETVGDATLGARHGPAAAMPGMRLVSDGWEPIGLAAVQDLVQARLGPVDLDRTPVSLEPANSPAAGCPACDGQRFGYPAELAGSAERMCAPHHTAAMEVIAGATVVPSAATPRAGRRSGPG